MSDPTALPNYIECHTQGQVGKETMVVSTGRSVCGDILDGLAIRLGSERGGFVVEWADFERAYLVNKQMRERIGPPYKSIAEATAGRSSLEPTGKQ